MPTLITTTLGELDEALLEKREGAIDNDNERTTWVEYRLAGQPDSEAIHRSVHVQLKRGVEAFSEVQGF